MEKVNQLLTEVAEFSFSVIYLWPGLYTALPLPPTPHCLTDSHT